MDVRGWSVGLVAVLWGSTVQAQEGRVYRLVYSAPPQCPDRAAFSAEVQSNSARVRHALAEETAATVRATVTARDGEFEGKLSIRQPDGTEAVRSVTNGDCSETVDAMALMVTLTLDPDASEPPLFEETEAPEPEADGPPTPYDSGYTGGTRPREFESSVGADTPPNQRRRGSGEGSPRFIPIASVGIVSANGPEPSIEYGGGLGLTLGTGRLPPLLVFSGHFAGSMVIRDEGDVQFSRMVGRAAVCPALAGTEVVTLRACLFLGAGVFEASGAARSMVGASQMPWLEAGTKLRGEAKALGSLVVGTEVGAAAHFVRSIYYFAGTGSEVFTVPSFGFAATVDVGLRI